MDIVLLASQKTREFCETLNPGFNQFQWAVEYGDYGMNPEQLSNTIRNTFFENMAILEPSVTDIQYSSTISEDEMFVFYFARV
jgi:hypothetical protein